MKFEIKEIILDNFKGVKHQSYKFKGNTDIKGRNGAGKSTILDAFFWLMVDTDYLDNSNPDIFPINKVELTTTVTMILEADGIEHTYSKTQKRTIGEGSMSSTNSFDIDGIPKKKSEIEKTFEEFGIKLSLVKTLCNPNTFTGIRHNDQRSVLFSLVDDISDLEIANDLGYKEIAELLQIHKADDIKVKVAADKKAVESVHGKKGEFTYTKIKLLEEILNDFTKANVSGTAIEYVENKLATLKEMQMKYGQQIANAERLISQLSDIENEKINRFETAINSHFKLIDFKLWETQKNGEKKPCCKAMIDGFVLGTSANTAREILAKLDIIDGLSKSFDAYYPVLLDGAEALDKKSKDSISIESQLITSTVSNTVLKFI